MQSSFGNATDDSSNDMRVKWGEHFQALFVNHPFPVYFLDLKRRVVSANGQALREPEVSKPESTGTSIERFIAPRNRTLARARWKQALAGQAITHNNVNVSATGKHSEVRVVLIPINAREKVAGILATVPPCARRRKSWRGIVPPKRRH